MRAIAVYQSIIDITRFDVLTFGDSSTQVLKAGYQTINRRSRERVVHNLGLGVFFLENPGIRAISLRVFTSSACGLFGS